MNIYSKIDLHVLKSIALASILCVFCSLTSSAQQISGVVTDSQTGDTLLYPSASYKGNHVAVSGDAQGRYRIERHNGWYLTFSAVGYQSKRILINEKTPSRLDVKLKPDSKQLNEVVIKEKRGKYSHAQPFTKESLLYREIFEKYYPGQSQMIIGFWMPNREWEGCDVDDPSARVLSNYGDSGRPAELQ
ncbi:MAG: carboxypeptidase-like regulatory domain-containing protein, partial [Prevotella sp.]|nr:carboxypeptidase-like regulatory domain-containing protein [Prevotella sp.]